MLSIQMMDGSDPNDTAALKKAVEEELEEFSRVFTERLGNAPLIPHELALLRTFLITRVYQTSFTPKSDSNM